jgi:hypothetical protein
VEDPLTRPAEMIGMAPAPGFFYIPGQYVPRGGGVDWRPGFWARSQPGWEWIPARWDRLATGWVFREGFWNRVADPPGLPPGHVRSIQGATLASTPAGISSPSSGVNSNSAVSTNEVMTRNADFNPSIGFEAGPNGTMISTRSSELGAAQFASRLETGQKPAKAAQSGQEAGKTTQAGVSQQPGDSRSGPQPTYYSQQPASWQYGAQPMYSPGRAVMWNARSVVGFLRQFIP